MKLLFLFLALTSVTSSVDSLKVEKFDTRIKEYEDKNKDRDKEKDNAKDKDNAHRTERVLSVLVHNDGKETVTVIELFACKKLMLSGNMDRMHVDGCEEGETMWLSGRFVPGKSSWSDELPIGEDVQAVTLVRVGTIEAK